MALFLVIIFCVLIASVVAKIVVPTVKFIKARNLIQELYADFTAASNYNRDEFKVVLGCTNGEKFEFANLNEFRKAIECYINDTLKYYDEKFGWMVPAPQSLDSNRKELVEILSKLRVWHWERYGVETK